MQIKHKTLWYLVLVCVLVFVSAAEAMRVEDFEDVESVDQKIIYNIKKLEVNQISDLMYLAPFRDVVVIQKRFMPKTGRMSVSISPSFILNSQFFLNPGIELYMSYHFAEKHGIELSGYYAFSYRRLVAIDFFRRIHLKVDIENPFAQGFVGIFYKWMPIYGKISFYNKKILSLDTFFNVGVGGSLLDKDKSASNSRSENDATAKPSMWASTLSIGVGQVFAITRDWGVRWDLRMLFVYDHPDKKWLKEFPFSIGLSYYYPSAGSR